MAKKKRGKVKGASKDARRRQERSSGFNYLKLPKGVELLEVEPKSRIKFDVIPYEVTDSKHLDRDASEGLVMEGDFWYKKPFKIHRDIGVNNETVVCPTTFGRVCPICDYRKKLLNEGDAEEEAKALRPSLRNLYIVIPRDSDDFDEKIHVLDISQYCFQDLLDEELEENEDAERFANIEDGLTLKVRFSEGSVGKNKFPEASKIDFKEREEPLDESILDDVPNLDEILVALPSEELGSKFHAIDDADEASEDDKVTEDGDENEDEDEKPRRTQRKRKSVNKESKKEDEDEKPKSSKKGNKSKSKEKDDECPFGHEFGVDTDETDDCVDCNVWNECTDAKEANEED